MENRYARACVFFFNFERAVFSARKRGLWYRIFSCGKFNFSLVCVRFLFDCWLWRTMQWCFIDWDDRLLRIVFCCCSSIFVHVFMLVEGKQFFSQHIFGKNSWTYVRQIMTNTKKYENISCIFVHSLYCFTELVLTAFHLFIFRLYVTENVI